MISESAGSLTNFALDVVCTGAGAGAGGGAATCAGATGLSSSASCMTKYMVAAPPAATRSAIATTIHVLFDSWRFIIPAPTVMSDARFLREAEIGRAHV